MWLERIERRHGKLIGIAISSAGEREVVPVESILKLRFPFKDTVKRRIQTQLTDWHETNSSEYVRAFCCVEQIHHAHQVFSFKSGNLTVIVPAAVFAEGLFCSCSETIKFLFVPQGLDLLCAPSALKDGCLTVDFIPTAVPKRLGAAIKRFDWISAYPSARMAWDSIYKNAMKGLLALKLPSANVDFVVHGKLIEKTLYATEVRLLALTAQDVPHVYATNQISQYIFHSGIHVKPAYRPPKEPRLLPARYGWALSDEEWHAIKPLFAVRKGRPGKYDARLMVNTVLEKLGTGTPWTKLSLGENVGRNAWKLHWKCRQDGRWDEVMAVLLQTRMRIN